jgi:xylan 1,4-beta-xylosidase
MNYMRMFSNPSPCFRSPVRGAALLSAWLLLGAALCPATPVDYQNPVIPGDHPDPSIIRVGNDFWATCTSSEWGPEFPLIHSKDLVNWETVGAVFPHRPGWAVGNFWAPEISEYKGRYAVYYVARERGGPLAVAVATADQPGGPYVDHGPLVAQPDGSIDPAPATDENGARYLIWKEDGNSRGQPTPIWAQPLNAEGTQLTGERHELIRNDSDWEGSLVEGPFILRRNGWLYLFYSGNGCCGPGCHYALGVARSRTLLGPWEKNPLNPILSGNETWKCPGHGSIVLDQQGRYWLLYHAYASRGSVFTGREGMLDEVKFGADGWPTINDGNGPSGKALSPFGVAQQKSRFSYVDDFAGNALAAGWQWPQAREPSCQVKHGRLRLAVHNRGTNFLDALLAHSTLTADYVAATVIETEPLKPGWAAGLAAVGNSENAMGVLVRDHRILTWRQDNGVTRQLDEQPAPPGKKLFLRLAVRDGYYFQPAFSADGKKWIPCGTGTDAKNLPPWDRSVRMALIVGGTSDAAAFFDSFSLKPDGAAFSK